ncbi:MAG: HEAT repeat domain-containing protein [Phycisphaerae bacterium]
MSWKRAAIALILAALAAPPLRAQPRPPIAAAPTTTPTTAPSATLANGPTSAPTTSPAPVDAERLNALVALIEGPNSPQARQTGARELLRLEWPETTPRLVAVLAGSNAPARIAVARTLAEMPRRRDPAFVEPLVAMLADADAAVRRAAVGALAAYTHGDVIGRMRTLALDSRAALPARRAAIDVLAQMPQREALAALVDVLSDATSAVAAPALDALEQASGMEFNGDAASAITWWEADRQLPLAEWQAAQVQRVAAQNQRLAAQLQTAEARLTKALRDYYGKLPEAERPALLASFLADPLPVVRELALELVQIEQTNAKRLAPETAAVVRGLLADPATQVRAAAVRAVAGLRDPGDGARFVESLARESNGDVRIALINGLGYVGDAAAVDPLLGLLENADKPTLSELATALGRLAERGVLDEQRGAVVATALLKRFDASRVDQSTIRERILWALSRLDDPRCSAVFVRALDPAEAATVRQAAIRGIAAVGRLDALDALLPATSDADTLVRRSAIDALAQHATSDAHLQALWTRLAPASEPDEASRDGAWRGALRLLASRSSADVEAWALRLPEAPPLLRARQALELLQLAEKAASAEGRGPAELGRIDMQIAAQRAALGQTAEALAGYQRALATLVSAKSPQATECAASLVKTAAAADRYDDALHAVVAAHAAALDADALWRDLLAHVDALLASDAADAHDRAAAVIESLQARPPANLPAELAPRFEELAQRAHRQRDAVDAERTRGALEVLRRDAANAEARATIVALGRRAAPTLRAALRAVLAADAPDAAFERLLHDLLKTVLPEWPGFAPDTDHSAKLRALDAANT